MTKIRAMIAWIFLALMLSGSLVLAQQTGSVSGVVCCDADYDAVCSAGEGVGGIAVTLYDDVGCDAIADAQRSAQNSAADGTFLFADLPIGQDWGSRVCYVVKVDETDPNLGLCDYIEWGLRPVSLYSGAEEEYVEFTFRQLWEKTVNGQSWQPGLTITAQPSDTIQVIDILHLPLPAQMSASPAITPGGGFMLFDAWVPTELSLTGAEWHPSTDVISASGGLTWTVPLPLWEAVVSLTKTFHVEQGAWTATTVQEELYEDLEQIDSRPFTVTIPTSPIDLWIDSDYSPEVQAGQTAAFALRYGNRGGTASNVMIRSDFAPGSPFASASPTPDRVDAAGAWAEWDVGDLGTDESGSIAVNVNIQPDLPASTTLPITSAIYAGEQEADSVVTTFHVYEPEPPPTPTPPPEPPPVVPEPSTLLLMGSAAAGLTGYIALQVQARRRRNGD